MGCFLTTFWKISWCGPSVCRNLLKLIVLFFYFTENCSWLIATSRMQRACPFSNIFFTFIKKIVCLAHRFWIYRLLWGQKNALFFFRKRGRGRELLVLRPSTAHTRQQNYCPRPYMERRHPLSWLNWYVYEVLIRVHQTSQGCLKHLFIFLPEFIQIIEVITLVTYKCIKCLAKL